MGFITKSCPDRARATKTKVLAYLVLGVSLLAVFIWTTIVDPMMVIVRYNSRVDYGTLIHEALSRETDGVHISAYLFNITNADEFISGKDAKLKVQEVGPFTYQENRTNEDLEIDKEAGVIRYTPRHKVTFIPEESVGRPEDVKVNMINIAMLSMATKVIDYGYLGRMGFTMLTTQLQSNATVQMTAQDYLWGYEEPLIKVGNTFLPGWISFDKLGLLDRLYDETTPFRLEVSSREEDKFMIKTVNGLGGLPMWGYPEKSSSCNSFNNSYEGIGYPTEMPLDRPIKIYRNVLCRFMELEYVGKKTMDFGVEGKAYKFSNQSYRQIPENDCLCRGGACNEGVSDISPCFYGLPLVLSNAHFLGANPTIYERIEGMAPNEKEHGSGFTIDHKTGMVMTTKFSVQVNVRVRDVGFNPKISRFSDMFVPIVNIKIVQPRLQDEQIKSLKIVHIYSPYIIIGMQLVLILTGLILLLLAARLMYWNWISSRRKEIDFKSEKTDTKDILSNEPLMYNKVTCKETSDSLSAVMMNQCHVCP